MISAFKFFFFCYISHYHTRESKHFASGIIHHTSELLRSSKVLNIYQLKIFNTAVFVHKIQGKLASNIFLPKFRKFFHSHLKKFSHLNYAKPIPKLAKCKCGISNRGPLSGSTPSVLQKNKTMTPLNSNQNYFHQKMK